MVALSPLRATLDGIPFNTLDDVGVLWGLDKFTGWGSPASTLKLTQKARAHGAYRDAPGYLTPRGIEMGGVVEAPTMRAAQTAWDRLCAAVSLDPVRLSVVEGDRTRWAMVQRDDELDIEWLTPRAFSWSASIVAPDPRKYGQTITETTGLPSSVGGLTWPASWPIVWSGVTATGILHVDNPGNVQVPVKLRIDGPVDAPLIRHVASGRELVLASSYSLGASWLEIDTGRKTVLEGGTASRNGWLVRRGWFMLDKGSNDFIFSNVGAFSAAARLTLTAIPTWL